MLGCKWSIDNQDGFLMVDEARVLAKWLNALEAPVG